MLFPLAVAAQSTTFVPTCGGTNDTAAFSALISSIGSNTGTIRLPFKNGTRCAVQTMTIPGNITLDNSDGTGIKVNTGHVLTVLGPVVNPVTKAMFFGPGSVTFAGNTATGTNGQALLSNGAGGTSWGTVSGGGSGGAVDSVFGRTGLVTAVFGDYTWALIDKTSSSLADITFRSASELSNGTTGTGTIVLNGSPVLTSPNIGAATATSINGVGISTGVGGKTLTLNNSLTLAATSDGFTFTVPGTGTGVLDTRTITEGVGLAGNTYDLSANRTLALGTPSNVSVSSTSSASGTTHSHGVASSSNPGAASSLLASDSSGFLQLTRLGIGTAPTQPLEVNGNVLISASTANLFLKDTSTGWQSASSTVVTPQNNNSIRSTSYTTGSTGWNVSAVGNAEFNNVDVRGAIHASIFTYNAIAATAGTLGVFKSAAKLRSDVTIPAGPAYEVDTVTVDVTDADGLLHASSQLFVANDILRLKDGVVGDTWLKVVSASDQTTFWRYTARIMAGTNNVTYRAGMGVPDYGQSGAGFIELTADRANAPYQQMSTHAASFTSSDANGTLVLTPRTRNGNLNGSYGYVADTYGWATGQYGTAGQSWMTAEATNGIRLGSNTTPRIQLNPDGSGFLANSSISWNASGVLTVLNNANIGGWAVNAASISSGTTYLASSFDVPAGQVAWFGKQTGGSQGWFLRDSGGRRVNAFVGATAPSFPYIEMTDGTFTRVVIGGLNDTFNGGPSVSSMGMKIWNSSGTKLVEFSDNENSISGWTIGATRISSTGIEINSGASAGLAFGTTPPTSATVGTGLWLDRTGLYGLASNVLQAKFDAVTGAIVAGDTEVVIDSSGIKIDEGTGKDANFLRWMSGSTAVGRLSVDISGTTNAVKNLRIESRGLDSNDRGWISLTAATHSAGSITSDLRMVAEGNTTEGYAVFSGGTAYKGVVVSDGGFVSPTASTILEARSTTGAFLPPRMTTTQRDALTPTDGMMIYNTTLATMQYRKAGAWVSF